MSHIFRAHLAVFAFEGGRSVGLADTMLGTFPTLVAPASERCVRRMQTPTLRCIHSIVVENTKNASANFAEYNLPLFHAILNHCVLHISQVAANEKQFQRAGNCVAIYFMLNGCEFAFEISRGVCHHHHHHRRLSNHLHPLSPTDC